MMQTNQLTGVYQIFEMIGKFHPLDTERSLRNQSTKSGVEPGDIDGSSGQPDQLYRMADAYLQFAESYLEYTRNNIEAKLHQTPESVEFDPDDNLVTLLEEMERNLTPVRLDPSAESAESKRLENVFSKWEAVCITYSQVFQDLRWKILIRDGLLAPRSGKTFTSSKEFKDLLETSD